MPLLTNGQLGILVDVIRTTEGKIDKLIIKLHNNKAGRQNQHKYPGLSAKYPNCVFIERVSNQYTLRKRGGVVGATATVIQFPIKLAFAITSHKIQGQTVLSPKTVALETESIFEDAQAHVMLSRVQQIDQAFIVEKFSQSKIRTSQTALEENKRLENISLNRNPSPWESQCKECIKVMSLNCAGLKAHIDDIQTDEKIKKADVIHLIETSLKENEENPLKLSGYEVHDCSIGNGMGICTYYRGNLFRKEDEYVTQDMQVTRLTSENLDIIAVYRSSRGSLTVLKNKLMQLISDKDKPVLITGDFNLCYLTQKNNQISRELERDGCQQMMRYPTHVKGGHIDHVYWRDEGKIWEKPVIERYRPYYTDHDASLVTIKGD